MTTCDAIRESLTLYALGDLDEASAAGVREHVEACEACRDELEVLSQTLGMVQEALAWSEPGIGRLTEPRRRKVFKTRAGAGKGGIVYWFTSSHVLLKAAASIVVVLGVLALMIPSFVAPLSLKSSVARRFEVGDATMIDADARMMPEEICELEEACAIPGAPAEPVSYHYDVAVDAPVTIAECSPRPAEFDSVAAVKSPVVMRGLYGSRNAGARAESMDPFGADDEVSVVVSDQRDFGDDDPFAAGESEMVSFGAVPLVATPELAPQRKMEVKAKQRAAAPVMSGSVVANKPQSRARHKMPSLDSSTLSSGVLEAEPMVMAFAAPQAVESRQSAVDGAGMDRLVVAWAADRESPESREIVTVDADVERAPLEEESDSLGEKGHRLKDEVSKVVGQDKKRLDEGALCVRKELADRRAQEAEARDQARFKAAGVNPYVTTRLNAFSTFSIDVDTASYELARRYMQAGLLPPAESVRTEEFVNAFDYGYSAPRERTFRVYADGAPSPFGHGQQMLRIGVKGRRLGREEQRPAVLTFLVDASGSMDRPDRIGLVKRSLRMLMTQLSEVDRVAIVQYGSEPRLMLEHTLAGERDLIGPALDAIQCAGSTDLEAGLQMAYRVAAENFVSGAENRVLLLSDGVATMGEADADTLLASVSRYREQGITCSVYGFGVGNYDDVMLETLANKGDGVYTYVGSEDDAKRVFVDELGATLNTIAKDVKIQVEYNPLQVSRYRQLGYENRQLRKQDFRDDTVDAGEVGSGQSVTALYELEMVASAPAEGWQSDSGWCEADVVAIVRVRYRRVSDGSMQEDEYNVRASDMAPSFEQASVRYRLAVAIAEFSELLRGSPHAAGGSHQAVGAVLRSVAAELHLDGRVQELVGFVQMAPGMSRGTFE